VSAQLQPLPTVAAAHIYSGRYDKLFAIFTSSQGGAAAGGGGSRPKSAGGSRVEKKISAEEVKELVDTNEHYVGFYRSRLQVMCDV
jgi:hypothetical protein